MKLNNLKNLPTPLDNPLRFLFSISVLLHFLPDKLRYTQSISALFRASSLPPLLGVILF